MSNLFAPIDTIQSYLQKTLDGFLPPSDQRTPEKLHQAVKYALLSGGKRIRPLLVMHCCEAVGGKTEEALPPSVAIEMIHAFSLIHDDLPAMDDDDLRRGQPTCHKKFGETTAILAGDTLATLPYLVITKKVNDPQKAAQMINELADATVQMINGQVFDTIDDFSTNLTDTHRLDLIHKCKTGALIRAACRLGAIAGNANTEQTNALTMYGESIGLTFQIIDDLLDATQTTEHIGKRTAKDTEAGKLTFPQVHGIEKSKQIAEQLTEKARQAIQPLGKNAHTLLELCDHLATRTQ